MRPLTIAFLAASTLVAGCNGCNSCFGTSEPGDDAAIQPRATTTTPPATADATPVAEEDASKKDAGALDAADGSFLTQPALTLTIRPPMPRGPIQSCGVYDGPRCVFSCDKGNCRQDCDGVDCEIACPGGYCTQFCGSQATCRMTCKGGHCLQVCTKNEGCIKECAGGNCT